jgi:riboflavin synthase
VFTGLVVDQGTVKRTKKTGGSLELEVEARETARELAVGDSVAISGVCLTATDAGRKRFVVTAIPETVARTTLGSLKRGSSVNLELAARVGDRIGGHLVQGHVDGVARALRVEEDDEARRMWFGMDEDLLGYLVPKGSVTLDGVSLTVVEVGRTSFQVAIIPHTLDVTTLGAIEEGSQVNVEVDMFAKYMQRAIENRFPDGRLPTGGGERN